MPDGEISLFGGELVNRAKLSKILQVPALRISQWIRLPNGLPFIRLPSGDPGRKGQRLLFNVAKARVWLERHEQQPNPTRRERRHLRAAK